MVGGVPGDETAHGVCDHDHLLTARLVQAVDHLSERGTEVLVVYPAGGVVAIVEGEHDCAGDALHLADK
jgi:hypothetical protein